MKLNSIFKLFLKVTNLHREPEIVAEIFRLGGYKGVVSKNKIGYWLKSPRDRRYEIIKDQVFVMFVRGLLNYVRIKNAQDIKVFNFEDEFIEEIVSMIIEYRDELEEDNIKLFNFSDTSR